MYPVHVLVVYTQASIVEINPNFSMQKRPQSSLSGMCMHVLSGIHGNGHGCAKTGLNINLQSLMP